MNNGITERTKFRCLFEQSGTFKGELKSLGFAAFDYDIRNDYGETDFEVDLFKEIESAFEGGNLYSIRLDPARISSSPFSRVRASRNGF